MKLVLASKSPRRKELLSMFSKDFEVRVSDADESYDSSLAPCDIARVIATKKAMAVKALDDFAKKLTKSVRENYFFAGEFKEWTLRAIEEDSELLKQSECERE